MKKIILVVEDYEDTRGFMKVFLESFGYLVVEAGDGLEAIEKFKYTHPDLILMDISLPMVDGLTTTKAIREFSEGDQVPIIAITAFGKDYSKQAIQAGCNDLLVKPIDFNRLEPILYEYLGD